jgi:hypothetical protein
MRRLSLFLACQHLNSMTDLHECEDQIWFKVQAVPVFRFIDVRCFRYPQGYEYPKLNTSALDYKLSWTHKISSLEIKLPLCATNQALRHEGEFGNGCINHVFLNSILVGGGWTASHTSSFTRAERDPGTQWIWGWVNPRNDLDNVENKKVLS